jgi:protoporphyrinogen oxidase
VGEPEPETAPSPRGRVDDALVAEARAAARRAGAAVSEEVLVLGGGPAGLTAGYLLAGAGRGVRVLEADDQVGGLARTVERDGFRFDLGGHRFFTKSREVEELWHELLGDEFLLRPRMSRIYWNGRYLDYPLRGTDVIRKLGAIELVRCVASYVKTLLRPRSGEDSFEEWVVNRFGRRLFELFFKSYTEKVWGVSTSEIRAEWAAQRINGLTFFAAVKSAFFGNRGNTVKSLINEFHYPRYGPGQMWESMTGAIEQQGGAVELNAPVRRIELGDGGVVAVETATERFEPSAVISSLPLRNVIEMVSPAAPQTVVDAAAGLRYRDFLTVALVLDGADLFPDNWIYIHEPGVKVGRIQNYRSWSPWMVPDPTKACVGLEYFCFAGDDMWSMRDDDLVELAACELEQLGLAASAAVDKGFVIRVPKAYPIYDAEYAGRIATIRAWLDTIPNLQQVGRNGLHRYNNSDHSMLTAMRAVENVLTGSTHDIWAVNVESSYHEIDIAPEHPYRTVPHLNEPLDPLTEAPGVAAPTHPGRKPNPARADPARAMHARPTED